MNGANAETVDYQSAKVGFHLIAESRRTARKELKAAMDKRAKKRFDAAKAMSFAFAKHRAEGKPVEQCKIDAKADVAQHEFEADLADSEVKSAQARLEELEGERASLNKLADWAREEA